MTTFTALLTIIRPINALLTGVAVFLGIQLGRGEANLFGLIFGPLSAVLVAAFANIDNDIADMTIDRINRPARPLPSGDLSLKTAFLFSLVILAVGLLSARLCGRPVLAVAGGVVVFLVVYNRWGKRRLLVGNLMVAVAGAMPLIYAGLIADPAPGRWKYLWLGFVLGFSFHLAREILKDIQDIDGDTRAGARTLPIVLGVRTTARWSGIYLALIALLAIIPFIVQWLNVLYLCGLIALVILPSVVGCYRLGHNPTPEEAGKWSSITKAMMAAGLVLLWLGTL